MKNSIIHSLVFASLVLGTALSAHAASQAALHGYVTAPTETARTIAIQPDTRYVNVAQGEIVKFIAQGQEFGFKFNGASSSAFDLQALAPAGALNHSVTVYLAPDPTRTNSGK